MSLSQSSDHVRAFVSGENLSAKAGYLVYFSADETVKLLETTAANRWVFAGVVVDGGLASGAFCTVATPGAIVRVKAGGTIASGEHFQDDASGKAVKATADASILFGKALQAAVDGDLFLAVLIPIAGAGAKLAA